VRYTNTTAAKKARTNQPTAHERRERVEQAVGAGTSRRDRRAQAARDRAAAKGGA
jgi:hypothetical protein